MAGRFDGSRHQGIGVFLQKRDRVFGREVTEESDAEGGLFPRAGVAEEPHFLCRKAFLYAEGHGHGRNELIGGAETPLCQGENGVDVVFLDADGGIAHVVEGDVTERVSARLVVGDMAVLAPPAVGQVDGCGRDAFFDRFDGIGREPDPVFGGHGKFRMHRVVEMTFHKPPETVGMIPGQLAPLPIEALVPMWKIQIARLTRSSFTRSVNACTSSLDRRG